MTSVSGDVRADADLLREVSGGWDYRTLPRNIVVGSGCHIEHRMMFDNFRGRRHPAMIIGDRVRLYQGGWGGTFSVEDDGLLEIGDDSSLVGAQVMCADHVVLGRRVVVSYNAIITDSDFHPRDPDLRRSDAISGAPYGQFTGYAPRHTAPVVIEDDVTIGVNAIVLKGVTVGRGATIYAGALVTSDVPPGVTVMGNPARPVT